MNIVSDLNNVMLARESILNRVLVTDEPAKIDKNRLKCIDTSRELLII